MGGQSDRGYHESCCFIVPPPIVLTESSVGRFAGIRSDLPQETKGDSVVRAVFS